MDRAGLRRTNLPPARNPSLDHPDLQRMRDRDRASDAAFDVFGAQMKRRWMLYVAMSVVLFPLVNGLLTPVGLNVLWFQILAAAAYGTFIAFKRPSGMVAALATVAVGVSILAVGDAPWSSMKGGLTLWLAVAAYAGIGYILGMTEHARVMR